MQIWAHRGASSLAPENTMAAFVKAYELGCDAVELDVHRTSDGVLVVMHDESVMRTTEGRGYIYDMPFSAVHSLDAGYKFGQQFIGEHVPSLEEVLSFISSTNLSVNIELKSAQGRYRGIEQQILQLLDVYHMHDRTIISSFEQATLAEVRRLDDSLQIGLLCSDLRPLSPFFAKNFSAQAVHPSRKIVNPMYMRDALNLGVSVRPYTVNDPDEMQRLQAWGVHAIITDYPQVAKRVLDIP